MDAVREQAEQHLFGLVTLVGARGPEPLPRSHPGEEIDAQRRLQLDHAARTLVAVGALSEADVEPFRRRLAAKLAPGPKQPAPVDDALARRAREMLEQRLRDVAALPRPPQLAAALGVPPGRAPRTHAAVTRFQCLSEACRRCGALSEGEIAHWTARLQVVDDGRTWSLERDRRRSRFTQRDLLAVLAGGVSPDGRLRITTAELYADGVVLRWHERALDADQRPAGGLMRRVRAVVSLDDDADTEYEHADTSEAYSAAGAAYGTARFATAVPETATRLSAEIRGHQLDLRLRRPGGAW